MIDINNIPDGIHDNISIEEYHANRTHISATPLKYARESFKHFKWFRDGKIVQENKPHFSFGNAFELALLDPHKGYLNSVAVSDDSGWIEKAQEDAKAEGKEPFSKPRSSASYQKSEREFLANNKGKYIIGQTGKESFEAIEEMLSSCYQDKIIQGLIKNTEYQLSLFWTDPETGMKLKTRPDICKRQKNVIINVKTTEDGSPAGFSKDMNKYDYPLQACLEITGCIQTGLMEKVDLYYWLVVEKVPPYNATIYEFTQSNIGTVMDTLHYLLVKLKKCEEQNLYPGYSDQASNQYGILEASLPMWYKF